MKRVQQGFTLIELMIVVAIVGILAAIALPAYSDYVIRSKMSEAVAAVAACKTSVSEFTATRNILPANNTEAGCSVIGTQYVDATSAGWNGAAIVYKSANTGAKVGECVLTLTPAGAAPQFTGWTGSSAGCDAKYVPSNFR